MGRRPDRRIYTDLTRRYEIFLFLPWALATSFFSLHVVGSKLFLIYIYGWAKVRQEKLSLLISGACWLVLFFATYPLIRLLLPKRENIA
jgi:hypothetical protein